MGNFSSILADTNGHLDSVETSKKPLPDVTQAMSTIDLHLQQLGLTQRAAPTSSLTSRIPCIQEGPTRVVEAVINDRARRSQVLPASLFADPAWDMLLELYRAQLRQVRVSVSLLCIASQVPATTALRWIATLEREGLVSRGADPFDARRFYIRLTATGSTAMALYFATKTTSCYEEQAA